jgi:hypothetical protein
MIVGIVAFMLILCNGIILGRPDPGIEVGLGIGWFVGLPRRSASSSPAFCARPSTRPPESRRASSDPLS